MMYNRTVNTSPLSNVAFAEELKMLFWIIYEVSLYFNDFFDSSVRV